VLGATGMARRWTFYIAPDSKILHIDNTVKPHQPGQTWWRNWPS
jgi:hypothetical protein